MRRQYIFYKSKEDYDLGNFILVFAYSYDEAKRLALSKVDISPNEFNWDCLEVAETLYTCSGSVSPYLK